MSTYTITRKNYYEKNAEAIKKKRKKSYKENIINERAESLERHYANKKRQNKKSLDYYHDHKVKLNKVRQINRLKAIK